MKKQKMAVVIGAGPAGLTAAYELLRQTSVKPIVLEKDRQVGGISRTVKYKGNRIDLGGHRFFSKSEKVLKWWFKFLPLQEMSGDQTTIAYHNQWRDLSSTHGPDPKTTDQVMLLRKRKSEIYYQEELFSYPLELSLDTLRKLGIAKLIRIAVTYFLAKLLPRTENNLEDFLINRFGYELYTTFFKSYTEKVWGVSCFDLSVEWGKQRIKGMSVTRAVMVALKRKLSIIHKSDQLVETSLIERFLYPKFGPGQLWEIVASEVSTLGGQVKTNSTVVGITSTKDNQWLVTYVDEKNRQHQQKSDYVISTMPIQNLVESMETSVPNKVKTIAQQLEYRDFLIVGLLLDLDDIQRLPDDTWIYIHDPSIKAGRLQIFNNWSPWMVKDTKKAWIGLEYFCNTSDAFWKQADKQILSFARKELEQLRLLGKFRYIDGTVVRVEKAYPKYTGAYKNMSIIQKYFNLLENMYLIGRNGMHKYNNQDHSMLTAMAAVEHITGKVKNKNNVWRVNTEDTYQEERKH